VSIIAVMTPPALRARLTRRSLWSLRYTDGRVITEGEVDWSLAPHRGRQSIRLYCPDGRVAELGNTEDATGRLFQLKAGTLTAGAGRRTDAHIIGIIRGLNGECRCAAWESDPGRLVQFEDNVFAMRYQNIGRLSADVLGVRPD
jgi:hypothetical protein